MLKKILPLSVFAGLLAFSSCSFDDFRSYLDQAVVIVQTLTRGPKPEVVTVSEYSMPKSRGASGDLSNVLSHTTAVSYTVLPALPDDAKRTLKEKMDKSFSGNKSVEQVYCNDMNLCVLGRTKGETVTDALFVTDNGGSVSAVTIKGKYTKAELERLAKGSDAAKLIQYVK